MNDQDAAKASYTYDPLTGVVWSKLKRRQVLKNGRVNGRQRRPYEIAFLIMEGYLPYTIDHKDGDRSNDRWKNLRAATPSQQSANTKKAGVYRWPSGVPYLSDA